MKLSILGLMCLFTIPLCTWSSIVIIAHRGNSSESPENTLVSFIQAIHLSVDWVELDVQLTKDKVPVVIHDDTLARTTDCTQKRYVEDVTLQEIQNYDAGSWFNQSFSEERIPTLFDVLKLPFKNTGIMIEIKEGKTPIVQVVKKVLECVARFPDRKIVIGSKSHSILKSVKEFALNQAVVAIVEERCDFESHRTLSPEYWAISSHLVTSDVVNSCQTNQSQVWVWTVDSPKMMQKFVKMGVHGLITNYPKKAQTLFRK